MDVKDLSREQLKELKENMLCNSDDDNFPSWGELLEVDTIITDEAVFKEYAGVDFVNDDFFCTAGM